MGVDILIQNVSSQCIPNMVAVRTFKPRKIIWISTKESQSTLKSLQSNTSSEVSNQEVWEVDARDSVKLHDVLKKRFLSLSIDQRIVHHFTGGTKSMALQGLYNLGIHRRAGNTQVEGVLMDPKSQCFDVIYPYPKNNTYPCASLTLSEMMAVHDNKLDSNHTDTSLQWCEKHRDLWLNIRTHYQIFKSQWQANDMRALHARPPKGSQRYFRYQKSFPAIYRQLMQDFQTHGLIRQLSFPKANEVKYQQQKQDVIKLLNGGWLECWLGAVLYRSDIQWQQAYVGAVVLEGKGGKQEFDFLGASHRNRLIYWSCKTDKKLSNDKLFEVDALRDGIAGDDFHIAGLLHTSDVMPTMEAKAKRMRVHLIHALAPDAEQKIINISHG